MAAAGRLSAQASFRFERISVGRGVSQATVRAVLQDSAGFVWFGTEDGLNRYDGYALKAFRHVDADSLSLGHNVILSLREEPGGILWVGTERGLNRLDTRTGRSTAYVFSAADSVPNNNWIRSQLRDRSGRLWVGTRNGLGWLDEASKQLRSFPMPGIGPQTPVVMIHQDRAGLLWFGTVGEGLVRFDPHGGTTRHFVEIAGDSSSRARTFFATHEDPDGALWFGTGMGLVRYDAGSDRFVRCPLSSDPRLGTPLIHALVGDSTGLLWIGTEDNGLYRLESRTGTSLRFARSTSDPASLGGNSVYGLWLGREGSLWVGLVGAGANRLDQGGRRFSSIGAFTGNGSGPSSPFIASLHADRDGTVWVGTVGAGLHRFDRPAGAMRRIALRGAESVYSIAEDRAGRLWLSTGAGVFHFDRGTEQYAALRSPNCGLPTCPGLGRARLLVDRRNRLWMMGGVQVARQDMPGAPLTIFRIDGANTIFEDRAGTVWLGGRLGLYRLPDDSGAPIRYQHVAGDPGSLSDSDVRSVAEDAAGVLWVGTAAGLNAFDRTTNRATHVRLGNGLLNEFIGSILVDEGGDVWMSTNGGIERLTPTTGRIRHYDVRDGLHSDQFNVGVAVRDVTGAMYFGGAEGLSSFHPGAIHDNPVLPQVAITGFKRFNRPEELSRFLDARGRLVLPARDN
ncbi:MAG: hypothetical protein HOP28_05870, partial [Gemmatimonadales bacterium]|nr:hypothetical protein [Gemmatimonadales bacterium]